MLVGPGDDAAVLRVKTGHVVVSTDLMVEGRHFRRDWASAADIGHRAAAANLSDVNAMGGRAASLTIGLAAPADLPAAWAMEFAGGFADECATGRGQRRGGRPHARRPGRDRGDRPRRLHGRARAPLRRGGRGRGGAGRPAGLGGRRAGRAGARVPVAAGAGRGLPAPGAAVRRRAGGRRRRGHVDDRRLRRAGGRRGPPGRRLGGGDRPAPRRLHDPRAAARRWARRWAPTRCGSSSAAATTTRCSRRSPDADAVPSGWVVVGEVADGTGVTVDGEEYDGPSGWTHF